MALHVVSRWNQLGLLFRAMDRKVLKICVDGTEQAFLKVGHGWLVLKIEISTVSSYQAVECVFRGRAVGVRVQ